MKQLLIVFFIVSNLFAQMNLVNNHLKINSDGSISAPQLSTIDSIKTYRLILRSNPSSNLIESGRVWWDSTKHAFFGTEYLVNRSFNMSHGIVITSVSDSNSTAETTLYTINVPPNGLTVSKVVKLDLFGLYNLGAAGGAGNRTIKFKIKLGTTVIDSIVTTPATVTNNIWTLQVTATTRAIGANGQIETYEKLHTQAGVSYVNLVTSTVNLTLPTSLSVTATLAVAQATNWARLMMGLTHNYQ